jgi:LacI family transcriptional regulator, galactose operon repressor
MKNDKEITIYDIARELNVSPATVSRSLNNHPSVSKKTRKKITDLAKEIGYRSNTFASNLRRQRTHTIGVIVPKLNSHFVSSVLAGIEKVANEAGYNLIISQSLETAKKEAANVATMFNSRVDGLIVSLAFDTKDLSHFDPFFKKGIPVMFFDRVSNSNSSTNVVIDNLKAGYEATSHLISQGCKNIIHITGNLSRNVYADRLKGYRLALTENNIPYRKNNVVINNLDEKSAIIAARQLLERKLLPDGIFIANDSCAAICMQVLKEAGYHIPDDIAIVGFNNDLITRIAEPQITTVNYPGQEMGEIVARNLVNHLEDISLLTHTNTIIIKSDLIIRGSSLKKKK